MVSRVPLLHHACASITSLQRLAHLCHRKSPLLDTKASQVCVRASLLRRLACRLFICPASLGTVVRSRSVEPLLSAGLCADARVAGGAGQCDLPGRAALQVRRHDRGEVCAAARSRRPGQPLRLQNSPVRLRGVPLSSAGSEVQTRFLKPQSEGPHPPESGSELKAPCYPTAGCEIRL